MTTLEKSKHHSETSQSNSNPPCYPYSLFPSSRRNAPIITAICQQVCTFLRLSLVPLFPLPLTYPPSLQNHMHQSRINSNATSSIALPSASCYKMNCPAPGFTYHISIPLVCFYHGFHFCFLQRIISFLRAVIILIILYISSTCLE